MLSGSKKMDPKVWQLVNRTQEKRRKKTQREDQWRISTAEQHWGWPKAFCVCVYRDLFLLSIFHSPAWHSVCASSILNDLFCVLLFLFPSITHFICVLCHSHPSALNFTCKEVYWTYVLLIITESGCVLWSHDTVTHSCCIYDLSRTTTQYVVREELWGNRKGTQNHQGRNRKLV